jgi:cob(I)alamin adenosyltransferase
MQDLIILLDADANKAELLKKINDIYETKNAQNALLEAQALMALLREDADKSKIDELLKVVKHYIFDSGNVIAMRQMKELEEVN